MRFAPHVIIGILFVLFAVSAIYQAVGHWHDRRIERMEGESPQYRRMVDTAP